MSFHRRPVARTLFQSPPPTGAVFSSPSPSSPCHSSDATQSPPPVFDPPSSSKPAPPSSGNPSSSNTPLLTPPPPKRHKSNTAPTIHVPSPPPRPRGLKALSDGLAKYTAEVERVRTALVMESQRCCAMRAAARRRKAGANAQDADEEGESCPICLETMRTPGTSLTRCGHMFHTTCIKDHMGVESQKRNDNCPCPICRRPLCGTAELVQVMNGIAEGNLDDHGRAGVDKLGDEMTEQEVAFVLEGVMDGVLREVAETIGRGDGVVGILDRIEEEVEQVLREWKKRAELEWDNFEKASEEIRQEKKKAERERRDLGHARAEVEMEMRKVKDEFAEVKKRMVEVERVRTEIVKKSLEIETEKMRAVEERVGVKRTKARLERLYKAKTEEEDFGGTSSMGNHNWRELKKENERLKKEVAELKDKQSSFMGGAKGDEFKLFTGEKMSKPSEFNRPKAPRKGGLSGFGPKRSKVQRPGKGIGERKR